MESAWKAVKLLLIAAAIVGAAAFGLLQARKLWPRDTIIVRTHKIHKGDVLDIVSNTNAGEVKAIRDASIRGSTGGEITGLYVKRGDRVAAGQKILEVKHDELDVRLRLTRAQLQVGITARDAAATRVAITRREFDRTKQLFAKALVSQQVMDKAEAELQAAEEALKTSDANLAPLRASIDAANEAISRSVLTAPFAGLVTDVHVELGEMLTPGAPVYQLIDDTTIFVEAPLDEVDVARLKTGMPVRVLMDALGDDAVPARLTEIAPTVTADLRGNRHVIIRATFDGPLDSRVRVGLSADVEVVVDRRASVLFAPSYAVMGKGAKRTVYQVNSKGKVAAANVEVGLTNWERTEILAGLANGDEIIVTLNVAGLEPGANVEVLREEAGGDAPGGPEQPPSSPEALDHAATGNP